MYTAGLLQPLSSVTSVIHYSNIDGYNVFEQLNPYNKLSSTSNAYMPSPPAGQSLAMDPYKEAYPYPQHYSDSDLMDHQVTEETMKPKNRLGYHRTSIACSYCRRRKIRCIRPENSESSPCNNCVRMHRECIVKPVENSKRHRMKGPSYLKPGFSDEYEKSGLRSISNMPKTPTRPIGFSKERSEPEPQSMPARSMEDGPTMARSVPAGMTLTGTCRERYEEYAAAQEDNAFVRPAHPIQYLNEPFYPEDAASTSQQPSPPLSTAFTTPGSDFNIHPIPQLRHYNQVPSSQMLVEEEFSAPGLVRPRINRPTLPHSYSESELGAGAEGRAHYWTSPQQHSRQQSQQVPRSWDYSTAAETYGEEQQYSMSHQATAPKYSTSPAPVQSFAPGQQDMYFSPEPSTRQQAREAANHALAMTYQDPTTPTEDMFRHASHSTYSSSSNASRPITGSFTHALESPELRQHGFHLPMPANSWQSGSGFPNDPNPTPPIAGYQTSPGLYYGAGQGDYFGQSGTRTGDGSAYASLNASPGMRGTQDGQELQYLPQEGEHHGPEYM
ncbi:hypothetical protein SAICODRAFT_68608 [Saitoella complicata NRRL Y-17804]|nr:uncharacterized protein SAICODRAFT_68608 [Saitoella complicata NRRL Y-17804]ODQ56249.1 hypothetical protein SAICODRAFT_68608 [Saitoella complicata NRRL Y-17804]